MTDAIQITETQADHIHGRTLIKPGDKVEYQSKMCRVIEVNPENNRLSIHKIGGMHSSVESIFAEAITDYERRD